MPSLQAVAEPYPAPARWQVRLLGAVEATDGVQRITRFPSRAAAALLARLALSPGRALSREELVELLWPGVELDVGRNRLRQALSALRSLLEPAGAAGVVIEADRSSVRALPGTIACDALAFERELRSGRAEAAIAWYQGELMPGFYDEWIVDERTRLQALRDRVADPVPVPQPTAPAAASGPSPASPLLPAALPLLPLPHYLTRLFGAEAAVARLRERITADRLVTLLGPGGSGKTRLAVETARVLRDAKGTPGQAFDRIAFVALAPVTDAAGLLDAVARTLRLAPSSMGGAASPIDALADALAGQRVLLVLDNAEQLADDAVAAIAALLQRLPALHLLVTSRRTLSIDGERCVAAEPLALPGPPAGRDALAAAAANPAVALFVDRARAARTDFHLHEGNVADIVALTRALGGLPLAIELAASRVRSIAPAQMAELLTRRGEGAGALPLLARRGPRAGQDARHASMEEVIDWSWRLLAPPAQRTLMALAVFHGPTGTAAVAAVAELGDAAAALQLDELVSHSLVRTTGGADGRPRFALDEPIREFAAARAGAAALRAMRSRLRAWLLAWARALGEAAREPARVAAELPEVQAALVAAPADGEPQATLALALALRAYWDADGLPFACTQAVAAALHAIEGDAGAEHAEVHELLAYLRFSAGQAELAQQHAEAALAAAAPGSAQRARALVRRAWVALSSGREAQPGGLDAAQVQAMLAEALQLARATGDRATEAEALYQQAVAANQCDGDAARAERLLEASQTLWLTLGDRRKAFGRLRNRAQMWARLGRRDEAMAAFQACEQAAREDGDWVGQIAAALTIAGHSAKGRAWEVSLAAARRAVVLCWQRWQHHGMAFALWTPPRVLAHLRRPEDAIRLMAFANGFWSQRFGPLTASDQRDVRRVRRLVRAQIGAARCEALWIEGAAMPLPEAVALALRD